jgi:hypothetical protein
MVTRRPTSSSPLMSMPSMSPTRLDSSKCFITPPSYDLQENKSHLLLRQRAKYFWTQPRYFYEFFLVFLMRKKGDARKREVGDMIEGDDETKKKAARVN